MGKDLGLKSEERRKEIMAAYEQMLPRMFDYVDKYAQEKPSEIAIIEYNTGAEVTWADFQRASVVFAARLLSIGLKKGDIICTTLALLKEHIYLMYGAMRIGVIVAPLDLRLKEHEIESCFDLVKPKAYFFLGKTPVIDFRPQVQNLMKKYKGDGPGQCAHWVQFQKEEDLIVPGAVSATNFMGSVKTLFVWNMIKQMFGYGVFGVSAQVQRNDPAFIIFTTGSTGSPKAALLAHENILIQNLGLLEGFLKNEKFSNLQIRMLVNLPPSHVGCLTEQLTTTIFGGGVSIILHVFEAEKTLDAIQKYKANVLGQIPALFNLEWRLPNYKDFDLSSIKVAIYGGQTVTRQFMQQLFTMAEGIVSGLGLTETAGFCTYTPADGSIDDIMASIGFDSPLCPISVREPMNEDGTAGKELAAGSIGEICFGPSKQIFLGYYNDEENTKKAISKEGILYTGDIGSYDGTGLHFASRRKFLIKPKGYQVFPPEVEDHIEARLKDDVVRVGVVGVQHDVFSDGVVAICELREGKELTAKQVIKACDDLAAYKRPLHVIFLKFGSFPLNRVAKADYIKLKEIAETEVATLRANGGWDKN